MRALRMLLTILPLIGLPAAAETNGTSLQTTANDPLTPEKALLLHNYYQPVLLSQPRNRANQVIVRNVLPHASFGVDQLARASLPVVSSIWDPRGTVTGLGDLTVFDMAVFAIDKMRAGLGPLVVAPTATTPALGAGKWQMGGQTIVSARHSWGLTSLFTSYQQAFDGTLQTVIAQPLLFFDLPSGFYLRSSGIATFNLGQSSVVPVGLGIGNVLALPNGSVVNLFVEPQYSVLQTGAGVPSFQVFAGVVVQFPNKPRHPR